MFKRFSVPVLLAAVTCMPLSVHAAVTEQEKQECVELRNMQAVQSLKDIEEQANITAYGLDRSLWFNDRDNSKPVKLAEVELTTLASLKLRQQVSLEICEKSNYSIEALKLRESKARSLGTKLLVEYFSTSYDTVGIMFEEMLRYSYPDKFEELSADMKKRLDLITTKNIRQNIISMDKSQIIVNADKLKTGEKVYYVRMPMAVRYSLTDYNKTSDETFIGGIMLIENKAAGNDYGLQVMRIGREAEKKGV